MKHTTSAEESMPWFIFRVVWSIIIGFFFIIPLFTLMYIGNEILRTLVNFRLKRKYGPKTTVLEDGSDAVWLYKAKNGKRLILYVAVNDDPMDLERHRKKYMEKMLNRPAYEKMQQIFIVDCGFNVQKYDTNFDIKNHVKYLEGSEDRIITEDELMNHVLPLLSEEMDESKPQWEDVIIPRFKYNKDDDETVRSARVFRIHHAYMDGGSTLLMYSDTQYEENDEFPFVVNPMASPKIALWKRALYKLNCLIQFGWVVVFGLYAPTSKVVRNRFRTEELSGQTNYGWTELIPITQLKRIKDLSGQNMPTILMSVLGGAIRKLNCKFPPRNSEFLDCKKPDEITVGMVAGVFPFPDVKLRNRHSIFHMNVDVSDKASLERLKATSDTMKRVIWDPHVYLNLFLPSLFGRTPIWFSDACMKMMGFPLVLSNMPVAQKAVKLWGNDVLEIAGWPPMLSICGMGLVTIRYGDYLRFCGNSDNTTISKEELNFLFSQIVEEINLLEEELIATKGGTSNTELETVLDRSSTPKHFEDRFQRSVDGDRSGLKSRLRTSFNTIKDSFSKFREP